MKTAKYTIARPDTGAVLPRASVTVYKSDGVTLATLYKPDNSALANPVTADVNGAITFAAADGTYILSPVSADGTLTVPNISVDLYDLSGSGKASGANAVSLTVQELVQESGINIFQYLTPSMKSDVRGGSLAVDCYPAIAAILADYAIAGDASYAVGVPPVFFPRYRYKVNTPIQLKKAVHFIGQGGAALPYGQMPKLVFPAGSTGIIVHAYNTIGAGVESTPTTQGSGSIIEGLQLESSNGTADAFGGHGIWLRGKAELRRIYATKFKGNGFHIVAGAGAGGAVEGNANNWRMYGCASYLNKGHGLYVDGADANAGICENFDASSNNGWGIWDTSFLGNTYVQPHTASNVLGAYKTDDNNAVNLFLNPYEEGGQPASSLVYPSLVIGGNLTDPTGNAIFLRSRGGIATFPNGVGALDGNGYGFSLRTDLGLYYVDAANPNGYELVKQGNDLAWTTANSGLAANWAFRLTLEGATGAVPKRRIDFPNGYGMGGQMRYTGTAMPTTGSYVAGDFVENLSRSVLGSAGSRYVLLGWDRLTTGSGNTLNTDWVERRAPTGT